MDQQEEKKQTGNDKAGHGIFISFEGGEGSGKTTQIRLFFEVLAARGLEVVLTREPGGTPQAEQLRHLILTGDADAWDATEELMLFSTARHNHLRRKILPALAEGKWVITDRFLDSTTVYQGYGRDFPMNSIRKFNALATKGVRPDLSIFLDIDSEHGVKRSLARAGNDETRFENMRLEFHRKVRDGFRAVAAANPRRVVLIDAAGTIEEVQQRVWNAVEPRLEKWQKAQARANKRALSKEAA